MLELEYWLWEAQGEVNKHLLYSFQCPPATLFYLTLLITVKENQVVWNFIVSDQSHGLKIYFQVYELKFTFMAKLDGIIFLGHSNSVVWIRMPDSSKSVALKSGL